MLRGWKIPSILLSFLLLPGVGQAVSLGEATVHSSMMQPLRAEIALGVDGLAAPQDLRLRLAPREILERFGIPHDRLLPQLQFRIGQVDGGRWVAFVTTRDPVREPYFSFALNATWPEGEIVREYSLLLDPPELHRARQSRNETSAVASEAAVSGAASSVAGYGPVKPGETLWPIAQRLKPAGVSTQKMMMALLRANPHAFIDGNINRLKVGVSLQVPSYAEIADYSEQQARADVAQQMASWRQRTAAAPTPQRTIPVAGTDTAAAPAQAEPAAEADSAPAAAERLEIVSDASVEKEPLRKELLLTLEQVEADRLRSEALRDRVEKLEGEMEYLQRLLVLKERQIATLQQIAVTRNALDQAESGSGETTVAEPNQEQAQRASEVVPTPTRAEAPAELERASAAGTTGAGSGAASSDFERQLLVYAVIALTVIVVLLAMLLLRRGRETRAGDYTLAQHPGVVSADQKPYADQVRRFGDTLPAEPAPAATAHVGASSPPPMVAPITQTPPPPPPPPSAPPQGSVPESHGEAPVSDDDLAAWARDLDDEIEIPKPQERRTTDSQTPTEDLLDEGRPAPDLDIELDIPSLILDIDEELQNTERSAESSILELAQAYLEIGDLDGARELLEKVIAEDGHPTEIEQAKALLAEIKSH